jgi:hypothetical protein
MIVGEDFVKSYGGKVVTIELTEGYSTSLLIEKIYKLKMKEKKLKDVKVFNTKYKKGEKLLCIKDLVWENEMLFQEGESYPVTRISYSQCAMLESKTKYHPYYYVTDKPFYSPDEEFLTNEETHGGMGMSGFGKIDEHFKKI